MNLSINMLMKIALVIITILIVGAAFMTLLNDGGETIQGQNERTNKNLDCVMENKDSALDKCRKDTSVEITEEVREIGV